MAGTVLTPAQILRARGKLGPYVCDVPAQEHPAEDPAVVRAWAAANNVEVAARGPIPAAAVEAYRNREDR